MLRAAAERSLIPNCAWRCWNVNNPTGSKDRRLGRGLAALLGTPLDEDGNPLPEEAIQGPRAGGGGAAAASSTASGAPRRQSPAAAAPPADAPPEHASPDAA